MVTTDGITTDDWARVKACAVELLHALDSDQEVECRFHLLQCLNELETKYGALPSLVATRADFIEESNKNEAFLLRAYALARALGDRGSALQVAHSLASLYIDDLTKCIEASRWLLRLNKHIIEQQDEEYARELERLVERFRLLHNRPDRESTSV
jgi:hypothetical protein